MLYPAELRTLMGFRAPLAEEPRASEAGARSRRTAGRLTGLLYSFFPGLSIPNPAALLWTFFRLGAIIESF